MVTLQSEEVGEARSAFYKARADRELARASFEREKRLFDRGVGAQKSLLAAEAELKVAEASLDAAEKKLHVLGFYRRAGPGERRGPRGQPRSSPSSPRSRAGSSRTTPFSGPWWTSPPRSSRSWTPRCSGSTRRSTSGTSPACIPARSVERLGSRLPGRDLRRPDQLRRRRAQGGHPDGHRPDRGRQPGSAAEARDVRRRADLPERRHATRSAVPEAGRARRRAGEDRLRRRRRRLPPQGRRGRGDARRLRRDPAAASRRASRVVTDGNFQLKSKLYEELTPAMPTCTEARSRCRGEATDPAAAAAGGGHDRRDHRLRAGAPPADLLPRRSWCRSGA